MAGKDSSHGAGVDGRHRPAAHRELRAVLLPPTDAVPTDGDGPVSRWWYFRRQ